MKLTNEYLYTKHTSSKGNLVGLGSVTIGKAMKYHLANVYLKIKFSMYKFLWVIEKTMETHSCTNNSWLHVMFAKGHGFSITLMETLDLHPLCNLFH